MTTERITQKDDGQWYFRIRGNHSAGPFVSRKEAEDALVQYQRAWSGKFEISWPKSWRLKRNSSDSHT